MKKLLIVVDMQNDFITGSLGTPQAQAIVPSVKAKIDEYRRRGDSVLFTRDTHTDDYMATQEGRFLPIAHCIIGTDGHGLAAGLGGGINAEQGAGGGDIFDKPTEGGMYILDKPTEGGDGIINKPTFGSLELAEAVAGGGYDEIELCGLCTDICVVSNALILKARLPETPICVDAQCCAGVTEESHKAALLTMKMCQVTINGET